MSTRQRKAWRSVAALAALSLVVAACGDDDDSSGQESTADSTAEEETAVEESAEMAEEETAAEESAEMAEEESAAQESAEMAEEEAAAGGEIISEECPIPAPAESTTVDLMGWEFPVTAQIGMELEECNSDNLQVNVQLLDNSAAQDQITLDLSTGAPEFEMVHATDSLVGTWADDLVDLTPYIDKYRDEFALDDIPQAMWDGATVDGKVLGVPLFSNTMHFFYNTELLDAAGVTPPDSYQDLLAACGTLKEAGFDDPFNMNLSANWAWEIEFSNIIKSFGGTILNDDNTPGWNTPEGLEAVNLIVETSNTCMSDAGRAFGIDDAEAALRAGELPMAEIWASRAAQMDDPENSLVVDKIEFLPALKSTADSLRTGPAFVDYYSIPAGGSVDPEQVFLVIMAGIDVESQNAAAAHAAVARLSATNPDAPRNGQASAISVAEGVGARIKNPALPVAQGVLGDALLEITASGADPAAALAAAEEAYIEEATAAGLL